MTYSAGWFDDPRTPGQLRYFDGLQWTDHVHPSSGPSFQQVNSFAQPMYASQHVQHVQVNHVTVVSNEKSVGVALLLTFFFGPLGMLYSTVVGALVMMGLGVVLGVLTLGLWFLIAWPIQMIWAAVAASNTHAAPTMSFQQVHSTPQGHPGWGMPEQRAALPSPPPAFPNAIDTSSHTAMKPTLPPRYDPDRPAN